MTSATEMKERYESLYEYMAQSRDPRNMKAFGCVMNEMMDYLIQTKPEVAEEMIDELEAIKWKQYLTPKEADKIFAGMPLEEAPLYNRCSLWIEMNKIYSDFGEEIASLLGKPLSPSDKDVISACYRMALKNLKDKDGVYDIRKYFLW